MKNKDPFKFLYSSKEKINPLRMALGSQYKAPEFFEHSEKTLVATLLPEDADGFEVRVYETRLPATFYEIKTRNFTLSTGSGNEVGYLAGLMALALQTGMLAIEENEVAPLIR